MATADAFFYSKERGSLNCDSNKENSNKRGGKTSPTTKSQLSKTSLAGDYTAVFYKKPLKLTLVASRENYGTWEVAKNNNIECAEICVKDVLLAINHDKEIAALSSRDLLVTLQSLPCPLYLTFRRPSFYFRAESFSTAMAMYPLSADCPCSPQKPQWKTRASGGQWKYALEEDLSNAKIHKTSFKPLLSEKGDYSIIIPKMEEFPFVFGSSTRLYGTLVIAQILNPEYDDQVHCGDVIIAVNKNENACTWDLVELKNYIKGEYDKDNSIILMLRVPREYQKHLQSLFYKYKNRNKLNNQKKLKRHSSALDALLVSSVSEKSSIHKPVLTEDPTERKTISDLKEISKSDTTILSSTQTHDDTILANKERKEKKNLGDYAKVIKDLLVFKKQILDQSAKFKYYEAKGYKSYIMTMYHCKKIREKLPLSYRYNEFRCVYATPIHGWSTMIFYELVRLCGPTVTLIKDMSDNIFGIFASTTWYHSNKPYGNGTTFLFTLYPEVKFYDWANSNSDDIFLIGKKDALIAGGGKNSYALCLQLDQECGFTDQSSTFNNPSLTGTRMASFQCAVVETWAFQGIKI